MRLLSLFDFSGQWPLPFYEGGWDIIQLDIKHGDDIRDLDSAEVCLDLFEDIDGIIAAPPCTHFTVSGNRWWKAKDADGRTQEALLLIHRVLQIADLFSPTDPDYDGNFFWCFENPVGRLPRLVPEIGRPFYFNPCDYAGYLNLTNADHNELDRLRRKDGKGFVLEEVKTVMKLNAYNKKTGLWGSFNREIEKRKIEPVRCTSQGSPIQWFHGADPKTNEIRSTTPLGFAKAFYQSNCN